MTYARPFFLMCSVLVGLSWALAADGAADVCGTLLAALPLFVIARRVFVR